VSIHALKSRVKVLLRGIELFNNMKKIILLLVLVLFFSSFASAVMVPIGVPKKTLIEEARWNLGGGYSLVVMDVTIEEIDKVWIVFSKDNTELDSAILEEGEVYSYEDIFTTKVDVIFAGAVSNIVQLVDTSISSEVIGSEEAPLMVSIDSPKKVLGAGQKWNVGGDYVIFVKEIDTTTAPFQALIFFMMACNKFDEAVLTEGSVYSFGDASGEIFTTTLDSVFNGMENDFVQFKNSSITVVADEVDSSYISEEWTCAEWGSCVNGIQSRECTNSSVACAISTFLKPEVIQDCVSVCTENWSCSGWSSCMNGQQTRTCNDLSACGTVLGKPLITKNCSVCKENWSCGEWTECTDGVQTRQCSDSEACGTEIRKPETKQTCGAEKCEENWSCSEWSSCVNKEQTRTCEDSAKCNTFDQKPSLTKKCAEEKQKSFIERKEAKYEKNEKNVFTLRVEEVAVESLSELTESEGKVFVVTSKGNNEIKVLPSTALVKANFTGKADKINIEESYDGKAVYVVSGKKKGLFLLIFPVEAEIKVNIDVETGEIVSTEKPWWSFLVLGF